MRGLNLKVERVTHLQISGEERQRAPYKVSWTCTNCGKPHSIAYDGYHYLSYPIFGKPKADVLYCGDCEHEEPVTITLDLVLTVMPQQPDDGRKQRMAARP